MPSRLADFQPVPQLTLQSATAEEANRTYSKLLRSEMFESTIPQSISQHVSPNLSANHSTTFHDPTRSHTPPGQSPASRSEIYSLSPVKYSSQTMLLSPRKTPRAVSKVPYKVLDAPDLAEDFYLNLVDWGSQNILGVGLGQCVYMWNATSGRVTKLCELPDDTVTSVNWIQRVSLRAVSRSGA